MVHIAALALPNLYLASLSPLIDAFYLTQERGARILGESGETQPDLRFSLVSPDGQDVQIGRHGTLRVDGPAAGSGPFDFIWIPAFRAMGEAELHKWLEANRSLVAWLKDTAAGGALIGASGSAIVLPIAAQLTNNLAVPIAAPVVPLLKALLPRFHHDPDIGVAVYDHLVLSRGSGQDLQAIVAAFTRIFSAGTGHWIASVFGCEWQDGAAPGNGATADRLVSKAKLLVEQRFSRNLSIGDLAAELSVSHATLIRHFRRATGKTPSAYLQGLRLEAAQKMLLLTDRSVESIASAVGFGDARLLRQVFLKSTGTSATNWRRQARMG